MKLLLNKKFYAWLTGVFCPWFAQLIAHEVSKGNGVTPDLGLPPPPPPPPDDDEP